MPLSQLRDGCIDYLDGGVLDSSDRRYDEVSNPLVDEENEWRKEKFSKLNLPEEEMLRTETSRQSFPETNHPIESNVKIDPVVVSDTLKTTGKGIAGAMKSLFSKAKEFREKRKEEKQQREERAMKDSSPKEEGGLFGEVTHIREVLKKEPDLKTIEEIKKPELAPYPIVAPKTVEAIQGNESENVEEEIEEIKKIVEPDVQVPKDMPQHSKDPYIASSPKSNPSKRTPIEAKEGNPKKAKEPSWLQRQSSQLWSRTKSGVKSGYEKIRESDVAAQAILLGASGARKRTAWC